MSSFLVDGLEVSLAGLADPDGNPIQATSAKVLAEDLKIRLLRSAKINRGLSSLMALDTTLTVVHIHAEIDQVALIAPTTPPRIRLAVSTILL